MHNIRARMVFKPISNEGTVSAFPMEDKGKDILIVEIDEENSDSETQTVSAGKPKLKVVNLKTPRLEDNGLEKAVEAIKRKKQKAS